MCQLCYNQELNKILLCNWKEYGAKSLIEQWVQVMNKYQLNVYLAPPFPLLAYQTSIPLVAQTIDYEIGTGKVGGSCLSSIECKYAMCGHAELPGLDIRKQVSQCIEYKLSPFVFITSILECIWDNCVYIYEPHDKIGMDSTADPEEIAEICSEIRNQTRCPVLYGGSVNEENCKLISRYVDGLCVGRASRNLDQIKLIATYLLQ